MTRKLLSTLLSVVMIAALFAPITAVLADPAELQIGYAIIHGVTTGNADLYGPRASLQDNGYWSTAASTNEYPNPELVYVLPCEAVVDTFSINWYSTANPRTYTFGISVSVDGDDWTEILPTSTMQAVSGNNDAFTDYAIGGVNATYIKVIGVSNTGASVEKLAINCVKATGTPVEGGYVPPLPRADYSAVDNALNVIRDLTEDIYTEESWAELMEIADSIDFDLTVADQETVNGYYNDIVSAVEALICNDIEEIQIAQAFYDTGVGSPAWTNGAMIVTDPEYSLMSYKMYTEEGRYIGIDTWLRIFAMPADDAEIDPETGMYTEYEITNIKGALDDGEVAVTADEKVPQNPNLADDAWGGFGFVLCLHMTEHTYFEGNESQYASKEFALRNKQAFDHMELAVGDHVALMGVYNPYFVDGEPIGDIGPCDLETDGIWIHAYGANNGMGEPEKTPIYRQSKLKNPNAVEGGPQYLSKDQFYEFTTSSTMMLVSHAASDATPGDANADGVIDLSDLTQVAKAVAGWIMGDDFNETNADCNCDGVIDLGDVTLLAKFIAGWQVELGPQA